MASYADSADAEPELEDDAPEASCVCGRPAADVYDGRDDCPSCGDLECEYLMALMTERREAREV
jgi:hypothetical protein